MSLRHIMVVNVGGRSIWGGPKPWPVAPRWVRVDFPSQRPDALLRSTPNNGRKPGDSGPQPLPGWINDKIRVASESVTLSELLLGSTKGNGGDFLAYLPRIGDFVLVGDRDLSPQQAIKAVNSWELDQDWLQTVRRERSGVEPLAPMQVLSLRQEVGLTSVGGVVVAAYGRGFMDPLVGLSETSRIAFANGSLRDALTRADVFEAVSEVDWSETDGSLYPMEMLRYCNPCSLYPFALAYKKSNRFRKLIDEVALGEVKTLAMRELDRTAQEAIWQGIKATGDRYMFFDDKGEAVDPAVIPNLIESNQVVPLLRIERTAEGLSISLVSSANTLWKSWLKGVST